MADQRRQPALGEPAGGEARADGAQRRVLAVEQLLDLRARQAAADLTQRGERLGFERRAAPGERFERAVAAARRA